LGSDRDHAANQINIRSDWNHAVGIGFWQTCAKPQLLHVIGTASTSPRLLVQIPEVSTGQIIDKRDLRKQAVLPGQTEIEWWHTDLLV